MKRMIRDLANQDPTRLHVGRSVMHYGIVVASFGGDHGERVYYQGGKAVSMEVGEIKEFHDLHSQAFWECLGVIASAKIVAESPLVAARQIAEAGRLYENHPKTIRRRRQEEERRISKAKAFTSLAILEAAPLGTYRAQSGDRSWALFPISGSGSSLRFDKKELGEEIFGRVTEIVRARCVGTRDL